MNQVKPPKFPLKLLKSFCKPEYHSDIEGDLLEFYARRVKKIGPQKARWLLLKDVLLLFRPGMIRSFKPLQFLNHLTMLKHYIKLSFRGFRRHQSTFFINLLGLSTGLACTFLIYLWVADELSIDKFHENDARLYQVMGNYQQADGINTWNGTSAKLAEALEEEIPEIELAVGATDPDWQMTFNLSVEEGKFKSVGKFVDEDYFKLFSYDLLLGDEDQLFSGKTSIVISENLALNLFQTTENILGETVEWQLQQAKLVATITGVFKAPPYNSTDQFDLVLPFELYQQVYGNDWQNPNSVTYVLLEKGVDAVSVNDKLENILQSKTSDPGPNLFLKPYSENYLFGKYENGVQAGGRVEYVRLFSLIALFILGIACINFMNLSTAKSSRRMKEVGVKKTVGAGRSSLITQYLSESVLMALLSLGLGIAFVLFLLPSFNDITGKEINLQFGPKLILVGLGLAIFTGLAAGSYPALYLSGFQPAMVLKGKLKGSMGEIWIRKGLVVFQFSLSIILIVGVMVLFKQMEFIQNKNLGYDKDNIVLFQNEGKVAEDLETFLAEVKNIPGVLNASSVTNDLFSPPGIGDFQFEGRRIEQADFGRFAVNYDFIETLGLELKEGRGFSRDFAETNEIVLNESAVKVMGISGPIGKKAKLWGTDMTIVGVVQDFHFRSLHENVGPMFFHLSSYSNNIVVRINAGREKETLASLDQYYKQFNPGYVFDYKFLDEDYQALYLSEKRVAILSRYFAGVAIIISCLGLFGLATFTAERRRKEIGIRKILGSSVFLIIKMLSSEFTKMVVLAIFLALPISYLLASKWLSGFAYHITLQWWIFAGAGIIALILTWLTIGHQTLKTARINPVRFLRDE